MLGIESYAEPLSHGITAMIMILFGGIFYRYVRVGIQLPILGNRFVSKPIGFLVFIFTAYLIADFYPVIQTKIEKFMSSSFGLIGMALATYGAYLFFDWIFYQRS